MDDKKLVCKSDYEAAKQRGEHFFSLLGKFVVDCHCLPS